MKARGMQSRMRRMPLPAPAKQKADELKKTAGDTIDQGKQAIMTPLANLSSAVEAGKKAYHEASNRTVNDPATS